MTFNEYRRKFNIRLNPQQEAAVQATEGPVLLLAVPGSGKTTVLVARLGYLLFCHKVLPQNILTVTYTVAAARDMKRRFERTFGEQQSERLTFATINSLCVSIIRHYVEETGGRAFVLIKEADQSALVRKLMKSTGIPFPTNQEVKGMLTKITYCKNVMLKDKGIEDFDPEDKVFPGIYAAYQEYLNKHRQMDFDDQLVFAHRILRRHPDILGYFQNRYAYLCVDEAQDTSKIQHAILQLLAAPRNNIFMVGDEDQSIYGFRAAWPQALLKFEHTYPGAKVLLMETNYRSTAAIVKRADNFIQRNQSRRPKHMHADKSEGEPIRRISLADYNEQYDYLLSIARTCKESTAVLYRNNDSALPLINILSRNDVPFACRSREGFFFTNTIIRDLTDILRFGFDNTDREVFLNFYYKLDLKLKKTLVADVLRHQKKDETVFSPLISAGELEQWQVERIKTLQTQFSTLHQKTSFFALKYILNNMGYGSYLQEQRSDTAKVDILLALAKQTPHIPSFLLRLGELQRIVEEGASAPDCPFVLSTIHASKGLEYDRVFLIDVIDGIFPPVPEPNPPDAFATEKEVALEEERRLFYVGVTRAKNLLEILSYQKKFDEYTGTRSIFVAQLLEDEPKPQPKPVPIRRQSAPVRPATPTAAQITIWEKDYIPGTEVWHKTFGRGTIRSKQGSIAVIEFASIGEMRLDLSVCLKGGLIALQAPAPN